MAGKISRTSVTVIVLAVLLMVVVGVRYLRQNAVASQSDRPTSEIRVKGDPEAPAQITEFIDFQCPACAHGAGVLKQFMMEHPGIVFLQMKYFPLAGKPHGMTAAMYAECAARQEKFWSMHDMILEKQEQWYHLMDARPAFDMYAEKVGLNKKDLELCLTQDSTKAELEKTRAEGMALGIRSTPTYFINGEMVVGFRNLENALNKFLPVDQMTPVVAE